MKRQDRVEIFLTELSAKLDVMIAILRGHESPEEGVAKIQEIKHRSQI